MLCIIEFCLLGDQLPQGSCLGLLHDMYILDPHIRLCGIAGLKDVRRELRSPDKPPSAQGDE
jgi:hypothetical protein